MHSLIILQTSWKSNWKNLLLSVAMEPNPFNILGKRRSRAQTQNTPDIKIENASASSKSDREKSEQKVQKNSEKFSKRSK